MSVPNRYYWFFGPKDYKNSGIFKYCETFIAELCTKMDISKKYIPLGVNNPLRYIYQIFIFPLIISTFYRNKHKIFSDESFLLSTLFPFFPYKKCLYIIHDYRDFSLTKKHQNIFDKIYFFFLLKSYQNLKHIRTVICVSSYTKKIVQKEFNIPDNKCVLIENSFEMSRLIYHEDRKKLKSQLSKKYNFTTKKILLNVGSEEERKNIPTIILSMRYLQDYIFVKIGNPVIVSNRKRNLSLVLQNELENVFFVDGVSEKELSYFYQIADIYVSLSEFEGFGRTPVEAQMHGLPVIASQIEPLLSNLGDSALFIKNFRDPQELANAVRDLEKNNDIRQELIKRGKTNAKRFDVKRNTQKFQDVLHGLT